MAGFLPINASDPDEVNVPNGLFAKCPKRSRRVSDSEYLLSIKRQQLIVTKFTYLDLEALNKMYAAL